MSFKNLRVKQKITITMIGITILASIAGVVSVFLLRNVQSEYNDGMEKFGFAQGDVGMLLGTITSFDSECYDMINGLQASIREEAKNQVSTIGAQIDGMFDEVEKTLVSDASKATFNEAKTAWGNYKNVVDTLTTASNSFRTGDVYTELENIMALQTRMDNEMEPLFNTIYNDLSNLLELKMQQGDDMQEEVNGLVLMCILIVVALIVISLLLGVFMSAKISNGIAKPLAECVKRLQALAHGDLHSPLPNVDSKDEIGEMVEASRLVVTDLTSVIKDIEYLLGEMANGNFNILSKNREAYVGDLQPVLTSIREINTNLSDALAQITQSADQVSAGADQVSNSAQALAQGATEQASAVEELSATVIEITRGAEENAENAKKSSQSGTDAGVQLQECDEHMQGMVVAMEQIKSAAEEVRAIIGTIEDIAFQTNILALNAAVEAARAGSAGKGFAVVADEVRNLASKSDEAAKATKERIENAISAVQNGSGYVEAVTAALEKTKDLAGTAVGMMSAIAEASIHQAESVDQIREGIEQISAVVQTNSATSEETAAASEQLSSQSQIMDQLMSKFTLKADSGYAGVPAAPKAAPSYTEESSSSYGGGDFGKY